MARWYALPVFCMPHPGCFHTAPPPPHPPTSHTRTQHLSMTFIPTPDEIHVSRRARCKPPAGASFCSTKESETFTLTPVQTKYSPTAPPFLLPRRSGCL